MSGNWSRMPSPFPGMDPYLEHPAIWEEFHYVFITECMYHLSDRLPSSYIAKIVERIQLISIADEAATQYVPDIAVSRERVSDDPQRDRAMPSGTMAIMEPVTIPAAESIEVREGHIEVLRMPDYELVASIEVLSPHNKYGDGIGEYRSKRQALVSRGVHFVEIDLLRRGMRTELSRALPTGDYYALVFRADRRPDVDVYSWSLRDPLPTVRVPLKTPDGPVPLEMSVVLGSTYDRGRYARKLRGALPPPGALSDEDRSWAQQLAQGRG